MGLTWPQGQTSQDFDHWGKISSFFIHPSSVFENSLTMHSNESLHVQVQSRNQGLLVAMIKAP